MASAAVAWLSTISSFVRRRRSKLPHPESSLPSVGSRRRRSGSLVVARSYGWFRSWRCSYERGTRFRLRRRLLLLLRRSDCCCCTADDGSTARARFGESSLMFVNLTNGVTAKRHAHQNRVEDQIKFLFPKSINSRISLSERQPKKMSTSM